MYHNMFREMKNSIVKRIAWSALAIHIISLFHKHSSRQYYDMTYLDLVYHGFWDIDLSLDFGKRHRLSHNTVVYSTG